MKTFFRKLFNLRTDLELVGLLYIHYQRGYICHMLEREKYKDVLTSREHKRLFKLVTAHLGERATASSWCLGRGLISLEEYRSDVQCDAHHRKMFLASLYDSFAMVEK